MHRDRQGMGRVLPALRRSAAALAAGALSGSARGVEHAGCPAKDQNVRGSPLTELHDQVDILVVLIRLPFGCGVGGGKMGGGVGWVGRDGGARRVIKSMTACCQRLAHSMIPPGSGAAWRQRRTSCRCTAFRDTPSCAMTSTSARSFKRYLRCTGAGRKWVETCQLPHSASRHGTSPCGPLRLGGPRTWASAGRVWGPWRLREQGGGRQDAASAQGQGQGQGAHANAAAAAQAAACMRNERMGAARMRAACMRAACTRAACMRAVRTRLDRVAPPRGRLLRLAHSAKAARANDFPHVVMALDVPRPAAQVVACGHR